MRTYLHKRLVALLLLSLMLCNGLCFRVNAQVPKLIDYQGRLTDGAGNPVADGPYLIQFTIWNDSAAVGPSNNMWSSGFQTVEVSSGLLAYGLGSSTPLPDDLFSSDTIRWLGIEVGGDEPEIHPRTRLKSVPWAYHSLSTVKSASLQKLASGNVVDAGSAFPVGITLNGFDETGELVVVTSGYWDDGMLPVMIVEVTTEWTGANQRIYLTPYDDAGNAITGGETVHISWLATAATLGN